MSPRSKKILVIGILVAVPLLILLTAMPARFDAGSGAGQTPGRQADMQSSPTPDEPLFIAAYDGASADPSTIIKTAVDSNGNTFVAFSGRLIKYGPSGEEEWERKVKVSAKGHDLLADMALDAKNNLYVVGSSFNDDFDQPNRGLFLIKYAPSGDKLWTRRYAGIDGLGAQARALSLDSSGRAYVAGTSWAAPSGQADGLEPAFEVLKPLVVAYDRRGDLLWADASDLPDGSFSFSLSEVDSNGDLVVAGTVDVKSDDYIVAKYDKAGRRLWTRRHETPEDDRIQALGLDRLNNVYVAGASVEPGYRYNFLTVKYDGDGDLQWARRFEGPDIYGGGATPAGMAVAAGGEVYVTGITGHPEKEADVITVKYDAGGTLLWTRDFDGLGDERRFPEVGIDSAAEVAIDRQGNVIVAATVFNTAHTLMDFATTKYDADGNLIWRRFYDGPGLDFLPHQDEGAASLSDFARTVAIDNQNNIYVTGASYQAGDGSEAGRLEREGQGGLLVTTVKYGP
jgi:hypothetical protein